MAGAEKVYAYTKDSKYGSVQEVKDQTLLIAGVSGTRDRISIITSLEDSIIESADIVTNSGNLRPIDKKIICKMKETSVIALMYEAWEFRDSDIDIRACRKNGIAVVGTNEQHPQLKVFQFLGRSLIRILVEQGSKLSGDNILLICDNDFSRSIIEVLEENGLKVFLVGKGASEKSSYLGTLENFSLEKMPGIDYLVVASTPRARDIIGGNDSVIPFTRFGDKIRHSTIIQLYGDINRKLFEGLYVKFFPREDVEKGHMGVLQSYSGPLANIKLFVGSLKAAQIVNDARLRGNDINESIDLAVNQGFATRLE